MTKKDYLKIAGAISRMPKHGRRFVAEDMAEVLHEDNALFDKHKFFLACEVDGD